MKGVKGFNKDLICRGFQYKEGETFKTSRAKACEEGFHFCENPIDCLNYYDPAHSVYHEVEGSGDLSFHNEDSKVACTEIKIGARIDIPHLCKATFDYVKSKCTNEYNANPGEPAIAGKHEAATAGYKGAATAGDSGAATAGYKGAATAGNYGAATAGNKGAATAGYKGAATAGNSGAATAGNYGAATAGNYGAATAGNYGAATAGYKGAATAGYKGAATAGDSGAATAGNYGAATAGNYGAATAGYYGAATSRGSVAVGENGVACVRGEGVKAKGGLGAVLMVAIDTDWPNYTLIEWKVFEVDGKNIKEDTWYTLKDGELVEV